MDVQMSTTHQTTYDAIFQHPIAHNLVDLKENHPDIAHKVVGTVIVNEQHMTEDQLLAQARAIYTTAAPKNWYGTEVKA